MHQARGNDPAGRVAKREGWRGIAPQLAFIFFSTLVLATLYEAAKSWLFPAISLWESHLATIAVASILSTGAGFVALRKLRQSEESYRNIASVTPEAEQRLRESEANLAAVRRIAHLGIWTADLDEQGRIDEGSVRWSEEIFQILGLEEGKSEVSRANFFCVVHPDDKERIQETVGKALRARSGYSVEYRVLRPDGAVRNIEGHVDIACDQLTKKPLRIVGAIRDITDRKQADEKIAQLALIVESSEEAISSVALDGKILSWNKGAERIYGYSAGEACGQPITLISQPDQPAEIPKLLERLRNGERIPPFETVRVRKGGQPINVLLAISAVRDPNGNVVGTAAVARDITASKRAEERFYKAFHLNPEPITLATLSEGRYLDVNEAFLRITGYKREEVIGHTSLELKFWEKAEDRNRLIDILREKGSVRDLEIAFRTKSNERRVALDSADVIELNGQNCVIAILKDITERKSLESQLRQLQKMEAIGQLSGGIAHDFNNLLGVILGYSEFLEEHLEPDSKFKKTAKEITKAGQRAASLTRQLLAFSRQQLLEPKVLNLNSIVADTEKMLRRLIGEHIFITSDLAPDLGQVIADQGQVEQVLMNLAVNARDAMPEGGKLIIETRNVELDEVYAAQHPPTVSGKYVELVMTDSGVGMDAQTLSHIFEPFFTTKALGKGTGLGLATVYGVVKQSGGYIWVYSEPGIGTTFKIYLPRVAEVARETPLGSVASPAARFRGTETILLVEDEEALRTLTRSMLENSGYAVLEAFGGNEAIDIARQHPRPIDLLLTDIVMPGMNGRTLAGSLTRMIPGLKVVYMSGYTGFGHHGYAEPEETLLAKPITRDVLLRKLHEVLHLHSSPIA